MICWPRAIHASFLGGVAKYFFNVGAILLEQRERSCGEPRILEIDF
jgi:hypothetical protein